MVASGVVLKCNVKIILCVYLFTSLCSFVVVVLKVLYNCMSLFGWIGW